MSKTLSIVAGLVLLAGLGVVIVESIFGSRTAQAQMDTAVTPMPIVSYPAPMVLEVDATGSVLIRGLVESSDEDELQITGWGGTWTIALRDGGQVAATGATLESIPEGNFVGVEGSIVAQEDMTIVADFVRDWTTTPYTGSVTVPVPTMTAPAQPMTSPEPMMTEPVIDPAAPSMPEPVQPPTVDSLY